MPMLCMLQLKSEGLEVSFQKWLGWTVKTLKWRIENVARTLFRFGAGRLVAGPAKLGADWKRVGQSYKQSLFNAFSLNIFHSPLNIFNSPLDYYKLFRETDNHYQLSSISLFSDF